MINGGSGDVEKRKLLKERPTFAFLYFALPFLGLKSADCASWLCAGAANLATVGASLLATNSIALSGQLCCVIKIVNSVA